MISEADVPIEEAREPQDEEVARYHVLSGTAVAALVFGLLSVLAALDPLAWIIPATAMVLGGVALIRIAQRQPELVGRNAAVAGMALALLFGGYALSYWMGERTLLRRQAQQFGMAWFDFLARGEPQKAHQLTEHPNRRQPLNDALWRYYGKDWTRRDSLEAYVSRPLVRTLLALGDGANVRLYENGSITRDRYRSMVEQVYAVTYQEDDQKKTFFVSVQLERLRLDEGEATAWRVGHTEGGVRPSSMGPKEELKPNLPEPKGLLRTPSEPAAE